MMNNFEFKVRPLRTIFSLTLEDVILTTLFYFMFYLYCHHFFNGLLMFILTLIYVVRAFTIRHEKSHLKIKKKNRTLFFLDNIFVVFHTFYQEPTSQKQRKHLKHHQSHNHSKTDKSDNFVEDPHSILEQKNIFKTLLSNLFYEELMFYLDLKHYQGLSPDRKKALPFVVSGLILSIYFFGLTRFIELFVFYRLSMSIVWFVFSYVLHAPYVYENSQKWFEGWPGIFFQQSEWIFGKSNATVVFFHKLHHERPSDFFEFAPHK